jgi:acetolactate decarboxylase
MTQKASTVDCSIGSCGCSCGGSGSFEPYKVQWQGAQKKVLAGDIDGHVDLKQFSELDSFYGLGPLEKVTGEVTILDSSPFVARVQEDGTLSVESSFDNRACFLVYSQVPRWQKVSLPEDIIDEKTLERELPELVAQYGIDPEAPFPFLLKGQPDRVVFHVLNKTDDETHSPELHEKAKIKYTIEDTGIEVIGFYSTNHRGIFTPGHSSIHIHLKSEDGTLSGHVDALTFPQGLDLYLPVV